MVFFIKKRGRKIDEFFETFKDNVEISIKKLKSIIGRSTYHNVAKKEIYQLNQSLEEINSDIKLFDDSLIRKNDIFLKSIKKYPDMQIIPTSYHYILKIQKEINE